jgi:hypothetical protein
MDDLGYLGAHIQKFTLQRFQIAHQMDRHRRCCLSEERRIATPTASMSLRTVFVAAASINIILWIGLL